MKHAGAKSFPLIECRELPAFVADNLDAVRDAFQWADRCALGQAWLASPEADFTPASVRSGWRGNSLLVFAELEDTDVFTRVTANNQRIWEMGDAFEIFLQPDDSPGYVEFQVAPNNRHLQLKFDNIADVEQVRASKAFEEFLLPGEAFHSWVWIQPELRRWFVCAEIPAASVWRAGQPLHGAEWRFSFCRYDYIRGRREPIISSSSPHPAADFHRRQEWGVLRFVPAVTMNPV